MRAVLIHNAVLPVQAYGGTERVVWWLAKGLARSGADVVLACAPQSRCDWAKVVHPDFSRPLEPQLPPADIHHYFSTPDPTPTHPYMVTIGGNGKAHEAYLPNTAFVSQNHAVRHGAQCYVYNGVDPDDYNFEPNKGTGLLFLAKAAWRVKNVAGAIRIARRARRHLDVVGGSHWLLERWRGVQWHGMLGGAPKAQLIAKAAGLLFPVLWNEPFGIAVVEALVSGTPVLATPYGSLPELVPREVGRICRTDEEFLAGIDALPTFRPSDCRDWALAHFSLQTMTQAYLDCYRRVLDDQPLNVGVPVTRDPMDALEAICSRAPRLETVAE